MTFLPGNFAEQLLSCAVRLENLHRYFVSFVYQYEFIFFISLDLVVNGFIKEVDSGVRKILSN